MPLPCGHDDSPLPGTCRVCQLYRDVPAYRALYDGAAPPPWAAGPPRPPGGPGTELAAAIASLGLASFAATCGGGCGGLAAQMDAGGAAWCEAHRGEIVAWLSEQQAKLGWAAKLRAAALAVAGGLALRLDLGDLPGSLLDLALWRARLKAPELPRGAGGP